MYRRRKRERESSSGTLPGRAQYLHLTINYSHTTTKLAMIPIGPRTKGGGGLVTGPKYVSYDIGRAQCTI